MISPDVRLILKHKRQPVHKVTKVCIGWKELISTVIPICSSDLIRKPVESVPVDLCVHVPKTSPDS